ncbi:MAG TPA: polysaccharide deacetylase family protein [Asanoa sp.]|nr:polysaccharide deacetylase family protein [Asanoa sp.]
MILVPVVGYHSIGDRPREGGLRFCVAAGDFDEQMALLRERGHTPLTVSDYADVLRSRAALPDRPVVVTFDDGFADLASTALPVLRRHRITATAFLITTHLPGPAPRPDGDFLSADEIADLRAAGIEIGSHGHSHRPLDCLTPAEARAEAQLSRRLLEDRLGAAVRSFAYPYGYHGTAVRRAVRAAGYNCACAVKNALSHPADDVFAIARVLVERDTGAAGLDAILSGRGWPVAWRRERLRTKGWRVYRRLRWAVSGRGAPAGLAGSVGR